MASLCYCLLAGGPLTRHKNCRCRFSFSSVLQEASFVKHVHSNTTMYTMHYRSFNNIEEVDETSFRIGKYIPNDITSKIFWRNQHLECEKRRKRDCATNGIKTLFKYSCLLERNTRRGSAICRIDIEDPFLCQS